jgi:hypothetical protein
VDVEADLNELLARLLYGLSDTLFERIDIHAYPPAGLPPVCWLLYLDPRDLDFVDLDERSSDIAGEAAQ